MTEISRTDAQIDAHRNALAAKAAELAGDKHFFSVAQGKTMCGLQVDDLDLIAETAESVTCSKCVAVADAFGLMVNQAVEYAEAYKRSNPNMCDETAAAIAALHLADLERGVCYDPSDDDLTEEDAWNMTPEQLAAHLAS